jgi:hypothetical protein
MYAARALLGLLAYLSPLASAEWCTANNDYPVWVKQGSSELCSAVERDGLSTHGLCALVMTLDEAITECDSMGGACSGLIKADETTFFPYSSGNSIGPISASIRKVHYVAEENPQFDGCGGRRRRTTTRPRRMAASYGDYCIASNDYSIMMFSNHSAVCDGSAEDEFACLLNKNPRSACESMDGCIGYVEDGAYGEGDSKYVAYSSAGIFQVYFKPSLNPQFDGCGSRRRGMRGLSRVEDYMSDEGAISLMSQQAAQRKLAGTTDKSPPVFVGGSMPMHIILMLVGLVLGLVAFVVAIGVCCCWCRKTCCFKAKGRHEGGVDRLVNAQVL